MILTDGNEVSDFGEPLRFQKVLQGQEVYAFGTPYAGSEASRQHVSDMRCYPALSGSRIHHAGGNRPALGESFQFQKVLQGQETRSILSYGRGPEASHVQENNPTDVLNGVQVSRHGNSWSTLPQVYNPNPHPSPSLVSSQFNSSSNPDSIYVSQRIPEKFASSSDVHSQMAFSHRPVSTQQFFRDNQNFVSMCKSSCRLFGFPLTEGKVTAGKGEIPATSTSAYGHESNSLPCNEEQLYQPTPLMSKVMVSSCTEVSERHAIRDRLLDIAL